MALVYKEKQKIFHDRFINCVWSYIERQKAIEAGEEVPEMTTPFRDSVSVLKVLPVIGYGADVAALFSDIWSGRFSIFANIDIDTLFPYEKKIMKRILSEAIRIVIVNFEQKLSESKTKKEIAAFANAAAMKFLNSLRDYGDKSEDPLDEADISNAILKQNLYFKDVFAERPLANSKNYRFLYEADLEEYLSYKLKAIQDIEFSEVDSKEPNILLSLSEYLRNKYKASRDVQFFLREEVSIAIKTELETDYEALNGYEFDTEDESIRISTLETKLAKLTQPEVQKWNKVQKNNQEQKSQIINEPYFFNVRTVVRNFVGRKEEINQLHNNFICHKSKVQIVTGPPGTGKTQTILKYVETYKSEYNLRVRWLSAINEQVLKVSLREFILELGISIEDISDAQIYRLFKKILATQIQKTLLIFEDVDNPKHITQLIEDLSGMDKHHVIVTTCRNGMEWQELMPMDHVVPINNLILDETKEYISRVVKTATEEDVLRLAKLFNKIPLALFHGVSYIRHNSYDIKKFIQEFEQVLEDNSGSIHSLKNDYFSNLFAVLSMSFKGLSFASKAIEIMKISSYLSGDAIPDYLFDSLFETTESKNEAIAILSAYSLISIKFDQKVKFIYFHKIIQEGIRIEHGSIDALYSCINLLNDNMVNSLEVGHDINKILQKNQPLERHILSLLHHIEKVENASLDFKLSIVKLKINYANLLFAQGELNRALECYKQIGSVIFDILSRIELDEIETVGIFYQVQLLSAEMYQGMGNTLEKLSKNSESLVKYNQALGIKNRNFDENSIQVARTIFAIACVNCKEGDYDNAKKYFIDALSRIVTSKDIAQDLINIKASASKVPRFVDVHKKNLCAKILDGAATNYYESKQYNKALFLYKLALNIHNEIYFDQESHIAALYKQNIGKTYLSIKQYELARPIFEDTLSFYKREHHNKYHINIAMALNYMGNFFLYTKQFHEALVNYKASLNIKEMYGDQYIDFISVAYGSMGQAYFRLSMNHEAVVCYEKCLEIKKNIHLNNPSHKDILYLKKAINIVEFSKFLIVPFIIKELLESKSTLKYVLIEIFYIEKLFPNIKQSQFSDWLDNNYFLVIAHFLVSFSAVYLINSKYITSDKWVAILPSTFAFGLRLVTYDYFIDNSHFSIETNKSMTSIVDFFSECSDDMLYYTSFGFINLYFGSALSSISDVLKIELVLNTILGGASCYAKHQPIEKEFKAEEKYWFIPKIFDVLSASLVLSHINFKYVFEGFQSNKLLISMVITKQVLFMFNIMMLTDFVSKLLLSTFVEEIDAMEEISLQALSIAKENMANCLGEINFFDIKDYLYNEL